MLILALFLPPGCGAPGGPAGEQDRDAPVLLHLASDVWAPFTDHVGRPRVATEIVESALARGGYRIDSRIEEDFAHVIGRLRDGDLDGCAAIWKSAEREEFLLYSRPYLENRLVLVGREGSDLSAKSFAELAGRRIGVVGSYDYGETVAGAREPVFVQGASDTENIRALLRGEIDYVLVDELVLHHLFARHGERAGALLDVGRNALVRRTLHFAVRRARSDAALIIARFDESIAALLTDGSFHRALAVDWIRADVDGDGRTELVLAGDRAGAAAPPGGYELFAAEEPAAPATAERYRIGGETYEGWENVPSTFKTPIDSSTSRRRPEFILFDF